jgi:DNA-binding transcriptional ArsR family regulator
VYLKKGCILKSIFLFFISVINRNFTINMGTTKTKDYSAQELSIAKYAKALSHPARVAILNVLLKRQSCICGDIVDELPLSQSTVSQHLKELKAAGLIKGDIDGVSVCYCIDEKEWAKAKNQLGLLLDKLTSPASKCC